MSGPPERARPGGPARIVTAEGAQGPEKGRPSGSIGELAGASYLALLLGLVTGPLIARAVGPVGRGEIAAAMVYSALTAVVVTLGVPLAVAHSLANKKASGASLMGACLRLVLAVVPVSLLLAVVVVAGPLAGHGWQGRVGAGLLMAGVPVSVLGSCLMMFLVAQGSLRRLARVQLIPAVSLAVVTIAAFVLELLTVLLYLTAVFASAVALALIAWRAVGVRPQGRARLGPLIRFGLRGYPGYLAAYAVVRVDQAFIGPILGSGQLGIYAVAASIAILPVALARAIASRAFGTLAAVDVDTRAETVGTYVRVALVGGLVLCAGIALVAPLLLPLLYGRQFAESVLPLLLLLPGTVFLCGSVVAMNSLTALGQPGRATIAEMSGLVIVLLGLPFVLPRYGIIGAALLSTASYLVAFAMYVVFVRRHGRLLLWPRRADWNWFSSAILRELTLRLPALRRVLKVIRRPR